MIRELPAYTVQGGKTEVVISPKRTHEVIGQLKGLRRAHAADSVKGLATRIGFRLTPDWTRIVILKGYPLDDADIRSQTISFEIYFHIPFVLTRTEPLWDNIDGEIEISNIQWWLQ